MAILDMIFTIAGIGMLVAVVQTILKQAEKEDYGLWVVIAGSIAVFLLVVQRVAELIDRVRTTFYLW
jgi:stage III sporulation protein AC